MNWDHYSFSQDWWGEFHEEIKSYWSHNDTSFHEIGPLHLISIITTKRPILVHNYGSWKLEFAAWCYFSLFKKYSEPIDTIDFDIHNFIIYCVIPCFCHNLFAIVDPFFQVSYKTNHKNMCFVDVSWTCSIWTVVILIFQIQNDILLRNMYISIKLVFKICLIGTES